MSERIQRIKMRNLNSAVKFDGTVKSFNPQDGTFSVKFDLETLQTRKFWRSTDAQDGRLVITKVTNLPSTGPPSINDPDTEIWEVL